MVGHEEAGHVDWKREAGLGGWMELQQERNDMDTRVENTMRKARFLSG